MALDNLSTSTHGELEDIAKKHPNFESFMQDVERLADLVWHNVRAKGHDPNSIVGDGTEGSDGEPEEIPGDDNQKVTTPAEPASPSSEAGFPTTNVDVGTSQPAQH